MLPRARRYVAIRGTWTKGAMGAIGIVRAEWMIGRGMTKQSRGGSQRVTRGCTRGGWWKDRNLAIVCGRGIC